LLEVAHAEPGRHQVPDDPGHERRVEHVVEHGAQHQDLEAEDRAGDGRAEDRGEAGGQPAHHDLPPVAGREAQDRAHRRGERGADLAGRTLLAEGGTRSQGDDGRDQLHRRHP
jgi:hypothetical protein